MGCSGEVKRGQGMCVCKGVTVFEGAVIGQVFTGDVQMQCPQQEGQHRCSYAWRAPISAATHSLSTALIAIGIWQSFLPSTQANEVCAVSVLNASLYWLAGAASYYIQEELARLLKWMRRKRERGLDANFRTDKGPS